MYHTYTPHTTYIVLDAGVDPGRPVLVTLYPRPPARPVGTQLVCVPEEAIDYGDQDGTFFLLLLWGFLKNKKSKRARGGGPDDDRLGPIYKVDKRALRVHTYPSEVTLEVPTYN